MSHEIIVEQIDVMVMGPKKFEFLELVLEQKFTYPQAEDQQSKGDKKGYVEFIKKFISMNSKSEKSLKSDKTKRSSGGTHNQTAIEATQISSSKNVTNNSKLKAVSTGKKNCNSLTDLNLKNNEKAAKINSNFRSSQHSEELSSSETQGSSENFQEDDNERSSLEEEAVSYGPISHKKFCGIHKFTKMIETASFWITLNFYLTDLKIYDPILSESTRGNISIGILVGNDESTSEIENIKKYITASSNSLTNFGGFLLGEYAQSNNKKGSQGQAGGQNSGSGNHPQQSHTLNGNKQSRNENTLEAKINSRMHTPCVRGFHSLLCLRLRDQCRLIEETNNLRLSNRQIFRWVVDRFFENTHKIKLKESLGDEIEKGTTQSSESLTSDSNFTHCEVM